MSEKPILFNGEMVRAILSGQKIVTRRLVRPLRNPPFQPGDILYVRETWQEVDPSLSLESNPCFVYRATDPDWETMEGWTWRPSIHMPKAAARIWLRVTDVRSERLQDMTVDDVLHEGVSIANGFADFKRVWDSTVSSEDSRWESNPLVWAISFERIEKEDF